MKTTINIKGVCFCGCANSIHKAFAGITGVFGVSSDMAKGEITIDHTDEVSRGQLEAKLKSLEYCETDTI